jgi:hypothetical protein
MVWVGMIINEGRGKEMGSAKRWIWVLLVGVVVAGVMAIQGMGRRREGPQIAIEEDVDPVEIYFYLSEKPLLNKEVRLVTTVIPNRDIGTGSVRLTFPEGITLVEKEGLTWEGEIKKDEFIQLPTKVRLTKVGKWIIEAEVKGKDVLKKGVLTIEVTETDVSLSSEEAEYILNPLPPDKFVFVELHTYYKDKILRGDPFKNGPYYDKNKKKYIGFPMIKPLFNHIEIYSPNFIIHKGSKFEKALLIINTFFRGESIGPGEFGSGGGGSSHRVIESLPFLIADSWKKRMEQKEFVLTRRNILFTKISREGNVKFKYGEDKQVILKSRDSWGITKEVIEEFKNKEGDRLRVKFTTKVTIKNRGIIKKVYKEES